MIIDRFAIFVLLRALALLSTPSLNDSKQSTCKIFRQLCSFTLREPNPSILRP